MGAHAVVVMYKHGLFWYYHTVTYGKLRRQSNRFFSKKKALAESKEHAKLMKARFILYEEK